MVLWETLVGLAVIVISVLGFLAALLQPLGKIAEIIWQYLQDVFGKKTPKNPGPLV